MCGIAGFNLHPNDHIDPIALGRELLLGIEERGSDATGMACFTPGTGQLVLHKKALPASQYVRYAHGLKGATNVVLHARFATKGRPLDAANNHPIRSGPIVGVHNGHVVNDDELFGWVGGPRRGTVDSEAIFAVLARSGLPAKSALWRVEGRAAIAWIDRRKPGALNLARMDTSPLTVGRSEGGSIIFASTESILARACRRAGIRLMWRSQLDEGSSLSVHPGRRIDYRTIGANATTAMGTSDEAPKPERVGEGRRDTSPGWPTPRQPPGAKGACLMDAR